MNIHQLKTKVHYEHSIFIGTRAGVTRGVFNNGCSGCAEINFALAPPRRIFGMFALNTRRGRASRTRDWLRRLLQSLLNGAHEPMETCFTKIVDMRPGFARTISTATLSLE